MLYLNKGLKPSVLYCITFANSDLRMLIKKICISSDIQWTQVRFAVSLGLGIVKPRLIFSLH